MNLIILEKDNIVYVLLVNATMCLNSIEESNLPNLRNEVYIYIYMWMRVYYVCLVVREICS